MKLPDDCLEDLRTLYEDECVSIIEIADRMGCSRVAVYRFFKKHGIDTRKGVATRRFLRCDECGVKYEVNRARYRETVLRTKRHFCSDICYYVYLENRDTMMNRHKQRIARHKVSEVFDLSPENVVHHKDFNHFNTQLSNFMVFKNHSDHIKYHHELRQGEVTVKPLWDGRNHTAEDPYYARIRPYSKDRQLGKGGAK